MSNDPVGKEQPLSRSDSAEINRICERFESAWKQGHQPRIEDYLPAEGLEPTVTFVRDLAAELVKRDLTYRWQKAGTTLPEQAGSEPSTHSAAASEAVESRLPRRPRLDDYAAAYPQLGDPTQWPVDLILEEYRTRSTWGDHPQRDEYLQRFGSTHSGLEELLHRVERPQATLGRFELIDRLGAGASGVVWKARDRQLDRTVAVKIPRHSDYDPRERERFLREARAAAQLRHPHICSVHEVGVEADLVYIVSDLIEGKPYIMDFGLAKRTAGEATMTAEREVLGTPGYMSPEQARGQSHLADRRTDVYSLGVILYEMLTGRRPFVGDLATLLKQVIEDEPPRPRSLNRSIPRDLETICLKAMAKSPDRRYPTAALMAEDLRRFCRGEPVLARRQSLAARLWRRAAR